MNNKILITVLSISLLGAGLFMTTKVSAEDAPKVHPMSALVSKIASKFGLKEAQVQTVFDEQRSERQKEMQVRLESRLGDAVTAGKLTEAQKQLIIAKRNELRAEQEGARASHRAELEAWAKANNIDVSYLMGGFGQRGGRGMGGWDK